MKLIPSIHAAASIGQWAVISLLVSLVSSAEVTWTNSTGNNSWSTADNWDPIGEPTSISEVVFPAGLAGTITTTTTENALSLRFEDDYTLSGGTLALAAGNNIETTSGVTAGIFNALNITGGLTKTGPGTLILQGSNTNPGGTVIQQGTIRAQNVGAMGAAGILTTIDGGATLEIAGIILDRPILLQQGAILAGAGTATSNGVMTVDAAATLVHLATGDAGDLFTLGNGANDLTGGALASVIQPLGPGTVRLAAASNYAGSWLLDQGRLELGNAGALGNDPARSLTLAGGTLSARINSATSFVNSPGNEILLTADSTILSDRTTASSGLAHSFGSLAMGGQTLTIAPGANATSGTASIVLGSLGLSGNPAFHIENSGATGRFAIGELDGGATPRTIAKTGPGELSITGGATSLVAGSSLDFSGGGVLDLVFPDLGADLVIPVTDAQNPLGAATLSLTDGTLRFQANGANNSTAQAYQLATPITLAGEVTLDPLRRSVGANKTYELTGLTLADGTELSVSGANTHGIRLSGPLVLNGDAVLGGVNLSSRSSLLTLDGGIVGAAGDSLEIRGGTSPLNLTLNAASTYGGGTAITGGNVTVNAANAFGPGPVSITGGSLRVNGPDLLAGNSVILNGGILNIRNNTGTDFTTSALTVSGDSTLTVGNNGSGSSQVINLPDLNVSGTTNLTFTNANSFLPLISNLSLAGDLTLTHNITVRIGETTEDASPRVLRKAGTGTLELEGASTHSGGTEVLAGILWAKHEDALGSGLLTLGDTSGTGAATVRVEPGLTIANDLLVRAGSTGARTLNANSGNVIWSGEVELERLLTLNNGSSPLPSTLSGEISGPGTLSKTGVGEWILTNPANSFGDGETDAIAISAGSITAASDAPLGNPDNGITLTSTGLFRADDSFATARSFTFSGSGGTTGIQVTDGNTFTLNAPVAGTGVFNKSGPGTLAIGPGVDSSATRGAAANTSVAAGTLRLQGPKGLGDATPLSVSTGATVELRSDANTDFAHPFAVSGNATVMVDRAVGGSGSNGRHQLGPVNFPSGFTLTVGGANGYGLSLPTATLQFSPGLTNESAAPLRIGELIANPATGNRTLTLGGAGDIEIEGAMFQNSGTGGYGITKNGPGTFRFGTSVSDFNGALAVRDGVVDLNGLDHSVGLVTLGGAVSDNAAQVVTGAAGSLTLTNGLTFSATGPAPDTAIIGNVVLAPVTHTFFIPNSNAADAEVTIDGPLTGSPGSALTKTSTGTLRFAGSGNNAPGPVAVNGGTLELAKTGGAQALGTDALTLNASTVRLLASNQIPDSTPVSIGTTSNTTLDLNGFTETLGGATLTQSGANNASILATGTDGTLILAGDLILQNNSNASFDRSRNVLITGSGTWSTPATDGTLDLGGATRTIQVDTTNAGVNQVNANATIETRIINGGIIKTGPRTLVLSHPDNSFAGGLHIAEGSVRITDFGALGTGPITFAQSAGGSAALDFGSTTGTLDGDFTVSGSDSGTASIVFSAPAPQSLTLSGNIDLQSTLTVNVVNGTRNDDGGALLDLTGTIDDGASAKGIVKIGEGILRLAAGNAYSGPTTVRKGVLAIPGDDALGDSDAALTLDGGLLHATASITSPRDLVFGADGGGLRVDNPHMLEFTGAVAWGDGPASFHGSGMTILSGTSTGGTSGLLLGRPLDFATPPFGTPVVAGGHVLALRGDVDLPGGNIEFTNNAILSLGTGDFIRPLGTGPGTFQMPTTSTVGWAAHGADRIVNIDGDDPVVWGQTSPRFLSLGSTGTVGRLALGHASATHTVDFQSTIELTGASGASARRITIGNGTAALDAKLSGGFSNTPNPNVVTRFLIFDGDGTAEISGPLAGRIYLEKYGSGNMTLSGDNSAHTGGIYVDQGTVIIAGDAQFGAYDYIDVWDDGVLDASALTGPVTFDPPESGYLGVFGTLIGDAVVPSYFYGNGHITGDVLVPADAYFEPGYDKMLHIGGDLTLEEDTYYGFYVYGSSGLVPDENFNRIRVTGTLSLAGELDWFANSMDDHIGQTIVFILNDGDDPVQGQFDGLPEGAVIDIGGGLALQITYQANGDGGSVANDVGVTVIEGETGPDVAVSIDAPTSVAPGAEFTVTITVSNIGPGDADGLGIEIELPYNATFVSSDPAGDLVGNEGGDLLSIDLDGLPENSATQITLTFTAPAGDDTVEIFAALTGDASDANPDDNFAQSQIIVAAPPASGIALSSYSFDFVAGTGQLTLDTVAGANYVLQRSTDLDDWDDIGSYTGDGNPLVIPISLDEAPEFFRVALLPPAAS